MNQKKMSLQEQKELSDLILKEKKKKQLKCVYCGKPIRWGLTCNECGYLEDKALEKVD